MLGALSLSLKGEGSLGGRGILDEIVGVGDVFAQYSSAGRRGHPFDHPAQLSEIVTRMVGMRIVTRPEEAIIADQPRHRGDRALVRVARDVALPLEVI